MSENRPYPETDLTFPRPPATIDDRMGRTIHIDHLREEDVAGLVAMYRDFDPAQRAQGIPPADPCRIEPWVRSIADDGVHLVARDGNSIIGHAMAVPDGHDAHELAIFVLQSHQGAGIGRILIEHLLGAAREAGVSRIWLTVERWNAPALALYRQVGFETVQADRFDLEMALALP